MSAGGSTKNAPQPEMRTLGVEAQHAATNQPARPVPYIAGQQRIALTWLSDVFDVFAYAIGTVQTGKGAERVEYAYAVSCAGLIGHGPLDALREVTFDGEIIWEGDEARSGDSLYIPLPGVVNMRLYWGTETQPIDTDLATLAPDQLHPAYRGQAYMLLLDLGLGKNRTQVQNVEVVVERYPAPTWFTPAANISDDAHPLAVQAHLLQDPRAGHGYADDFFDQTAWIAAGDILESEDLGISPVITRQSTTRQRMVEIQEYYAGFTRMNDAGELTVKLTRQVTPAGLPHIQAADLTSKPRLQPGSWAETVNETQVVFSSRDKRFTDDSISFSHQANFSIVGEHRMETTKRPYATRGAIAQRIANIAGMIAGLPAMKGSISITLAALEAAALEPGDAFRFSYPKLSLSEIVCRATRIAIAGPTANDATIDWMIDRGDLIAAEFEPTIDVPPESPQLEAEENLAEAILEAPRGMVSAPDAMGTPTQNVLLILGARGNALVIGQNVYREQPSTTYDFQMTATRFAVRGQLTAQYTDETGLIDDLIGMTVEITGIDLTFENPAFADNLFADYLLFVNDEIIAPFDAVLISGNEWRIFGIRNRFDTVRATHPNASEVWIMPRAELQALYSKVLSDGAGGLADQNLKLQPHTSNHQTDLSAANVITVETTRRGDRPIRPEGLAINGDNRVGVWEAGQDVTISWHPTIDGHQQSMFALWTSPEADTPSTRVEIIDPATSGVVDSKLAPSDPELIWSDAELLTALGSHRDFIVRARHLRSQASVEAIERTVYT